MHQCTQHKSLFSWLHNFKSETFQESKWNLGIEKGVKGRRWPKWKNTVKISVSGQQKEMILGNQQRIGYPQLAKKGSISSCQMKIWVMFKFSWRGNPTTWNKRDLWSVHAPRRFWVSHCKMLINMSSFHYVSPFSEVQIGEFWLLIHQQWEQLVSLSQNILKTRSVLEQKYLQNIVTRSTLTQK